MNIPRLKPFREPLEDERVPMYARFKPQTFIPVPSIQLGRIESVKLREVWGEKSVPSPLGPESKIALCAHLRVCSCGMRYDLRVLPRGATLPQPITSCPVIHSITGSLLLTTFTTLPSTKPGGALVMI
jgi:hypothetical protein